ncbi:hypothetical protein PHMEG_00029552 [Phytophthora megakarya]|uniref:CCHC-type domain-containing protein n=1 Tax=Phytophthora megakarya TaxID=4795 RepID=A0A225V2D2_9STRA|nr:hypothetical protein PHMEG_00029552 [Phytophthora megakarya]
MGNMFPDVMIAAAADDRSGVDGDDGSVDMAMEDLRPPVVAPAMTPAVTTDGTVEDGVVTPAVIGRAVTRKAPPMSPPTSAGADDDMSTEDGESIVIENHDGTSLDLALKGAAESGRGVWSDKALCFIMGNKLMENASKWWVDMDRRTPERKRSWTYLKKALLRRYGEKLDKSNAEWRVSMWRMMPGETYADFAAGLRVVIGRNKVSERALLTQFYRNLDKTTRKLVQQRPPWATAPSRYIVPMTRTTGQMNVIPGVSGTGLPTALMSDTNDVTATESEREHVALFTNPQGVYNAYSGTCDPPPGHVWNGKYWYETRKSSRRSASTASSNRRTEANNPMKQRARRDQPSTSESEPEEKPRKKPKASVKQAVGDEERKGASRGAKQPPPGATRCFTCGQEGHWSSQCVNGPKCYACNNYGYLAKYCTDADAKARNDEYIQQRKPGGSENTVRAP